MDDEDADGDTKCDVCDGDGVEPDDGISDCHNCEGSGWFGPDGFPIDDD